VAWIYLALAGLFEIGWPVGLKMAQDASMRAAGIAVAVFFMVVSGALLWLAQKQIPMGTAYAVWTGIGAAGTFLLGVVLFGETLSAMKLAGIALVLMGIAALKLA